MTNSEQLRILKRGARAWNHWRKESWKPYEPLDLKRADLRGANLRTANLRRVDFRGADLREADLREADLSEADFTEAILASADLRGASLRNAFLYRTDLSETDLSQTDLLGSYKADINLTGTTLPNHFKKVATPERGQVPRTSISPTEAPSWEEEADHVSDSEPRNAGGHSEAVTPQPEPVIPREPLPALQSLSEIGDPSQIRTDSELMISGVELFNAAADSVAIMDEYLEGGRKERISQYYERDPKLRAAALALHGTRCMACDFDFGETYGPHGTGYAEVHHLRPVSRLGKQTKVDPKTDMVILCANCHRMIHRDRDKLLSLEELQSLLCHRD